jgi:CRISPR/Cas system-associated endonuclease Cas3-HD
VLVLRLAIELHYNLTQDLKAIQVLAQELDLITPKAIAMDEREKYVKESSSSWVDIGRTIETIE